MMDARFHRLASFSRLSPLCEVGVRASTVRQNGPGSHL